MLVNWTRMGTELRFEDRLNETMNFSPWKEWIALLLEENKIWDILEKTRVVPTNTTLLVALQNVKSKRMFLNAMKDHIILHVSEKKNSYEMWEA
jgi:hypothetical protein